LKGDKAMTNYEKMLEIVNINASKEQIKNWAYMNRIAICCLFYEPEFKIMKKSVYDFMETDLYCNDEHENWVKFLDLEFIN
jgi:hypothetical protein